jgi:hypothetical protein
MGVKAYLSTREKEELVDFIAGTGENYQRYLDWCEQHQVLNRWTEKYFHTWIQRRRGKIVVARNKYKEEVRRLSLYDKERRIVELERSVDVINSHLVAADSDHTTHTCKTCGASHEIVGPEVAIKLMEQKRKLLEAIAKERNEWLKPESTASNEPTARERLTAISMALLANATETDIVDGTVVVVDDKKVLQ